MRVVTVAPERLRRWCDGFAERHGGVRAEVDGNGARVVLHGGDGAVAIAEVPFPPLDGGDAAPLHALAVHALRERTLGILLVRLGGFAAGVFAGTALVASRTGARPVHGRSAAGGQSQQRFARRREGQARVALDAAADAAARVLLPHAGALDAVVTGGDRTALRTVLADARFAPLLPLVQERVLDVPDPRRRVLEGAAGLARAVRIRVDDRPGGSGAVRATVAGAEAAPPQTEWDS